jgi:hypothetical protein
LIGVLPKGGPVLLTPRKSSDVSSSESEFAIDVEILSETTPFAIRSIDPKGKILTREFVIRIDGYAQAMRALSQGPPRPWWLTGQLGLGQNWFRQTGAPSGIEQTDLHVKVSGGWRYVGSDGIPRWSIGGTVFSTIYPFLSLPDDSWKFWSIGANVRGGYVHPFRYGLSAGLMAGFYYTTQITPSRAFGFRNMAGPQIFPTFAWAFLEKHVLASYFKVALIGQGIGLLSLENRELAVGLSYEYRIGPWVSGVVGVDFANLQVSVGSSTIINNVISFSAGAKL